MTLYYYIICYIGATTLLNNTPEEERLELPGLTWVSLLLSLKI